MNGTLLKVVLDAAPAVGQLLAEHNITKPKDTELMVLLMAQLVKLEQEEGERLEAMNKKLDYVRSLVEK